MPAAGRERRSPFEGPLVSGTVVGKGEDELREYSGLPHAWIYRASGGEASV